MLFRKGVAILPIGFGRLLQRSYEEKLASLFWERSSHVLRKNIAKFLLKVGWHVCFAGVRSWHVLRKGLSCFCGESWHALRRGFYGVEFF